MFKVSHELPINMLDKSFEINDYEYCLPHLLDQNETYRKHFEYAKESGSYIIMDNSLHELGEAYDTDRLLHWINHLEPDEFIVPDVWQDKTATLVNAKSWMNNYELPENTTKVAVVQAKDYYEAIECYSILQMQGYKKIAFSYGADWYAEEFPHPNPLVGKMMGRIMTISKMYKNNKVLKKNNEGRRIIEKLFKAISRNPRKFLTFSTNKHNKYRSIADYISGMTDRFAINIYKSLK